jgi:hypothetical protein
MMLYICVYRYIYINGNTYKIYCLFLFISEILLYIPFRSITELLIDLHSWYWARSFGFIY